MKRSTTDTDKQFAISNLKFTLPSTSNVRKKDVEKIQESDPITNHSKPPPETTSVEPAKSNWLQDLRDWKPFKTLPDDKLPKSIGNWQEIPTISMNHYDNAPFANELQFSKWTDIPTNLQTALKLYPTTMDPATSNCIWDRSHQLPLRFYEFFALFDVQTNDSTYMKYLPRPVHEAMSSPRDPGAGSWDRDWEWFVRAQDWVAVVKVVRYKFNVRNLILDFLAYQENRYGISGYGPVPDDKPYTDQEELIRTDKYKEYPKLDQVVNDIKEAFLQVDKDDFEVFEAIEEKLAAEKKT